MIYEIISYEEDRMIATVKVANTATDLENSMHMPISLRNLSTKEEFEKQVYSTWKASWPARSQMKPYDYLLEQHLIDNIGQQVGFTIPIVPAELAQSSSSNAEDTDTNTDVQVL
jgi:hypothetical protein